jgi:hypothetical protein
MSDVVWRRRISAHLHVRYIPGTHQPRGARERGLRARASVASEPRDRSEQNGRHERFHLTLQEEAATPPAPTPRQQQARFDRLRQEFNTERPHEALGQRPPSRVPVTSSRPYPTRLEDPWYDATHEVRPVRHNGEIKWRGELVFVSAAIRREVVGIAETEHGDWTVRFMHLELGRIDRRTYRFTPAWHGRRRPRTAASETA